MTTEIIKIDNKIFEINYNNLDPNGNPVIVELLKDIKENENENDFKVDNQ
jgi:hypothetical protein